MPHEIMADFRPLSAEELVLEFENQIKDFGLVHAIETIGPKMAYLQTKITIESDNNLFDRFNRIKELVIRHDDALETNVTEGVVVSFKPNEAYVLPENIRSIASANRRYIFRMLLKLKNDSILIGHIVTKVAKELGLIDQDKRKLRGKTVDEWVNSFETDGRNTPNAWACQAGASILVNAEKELCFENEESYLTLIYYLNPSQDKEAFSESRKRIDSKVA